MLFIPLSSSNLCGCESKSNVCWIFSCNSSCACLDPIRCFFPLRLNEKNRVHTIPRQHPTGGDRSHRAAAAAAAAPMPQYRGARRVISFILNALVWSNLARNLSGKEVVHFVRRNQASNRQNKPRAVSRQKPLKASLSSISSSILSRFQLDVKIRFACTGYVSAVPGIWRRRFRYPYWSNVWSILGASISGVPGNVSLYARKISQSSTQRCLQSRFRIFYVRLLLLALTRRRVFIEGSNVSVPNVLFFSNIKRCPAYTPPYFPLLTLHRVHSTPINLASR